MFSFSRIIVYKVCFATLCWTLVLATLQIHPVVLASLGNGDNCTEGISDECDKQLGLICRDSVCQCVDNTTLVYSRGTCKTFTNGNCTVEYENGEKVHLPCLDPYASCNGTDICTCYHDNSRPSDPNRIDIDVRCIPWNRTDAIIQCDSKDFLHCPTNTGLICYAGYCQCVNPRRDHLGWLDENRRFCKTGPMLEDGCYPDSEAGRMRCDSNAFCGNDSICHCHPGFTSSYSIPPRCLLDRHESNCSRENSLEHERYLCNTDTGLTCAEGVCQCKLGTFYDDKKKACAAFQNQPCIPPTLADGSAGSKTPCTTGYECVLADPEINPYIGICKRLTETKSYSS